jgi:hypothetical protein
MRYVEKYCRARKATNYNIIWLMRIACCIKKATDTHSEYVILLLFYHVDYEIRGKILYSEAGHR